MASIDTLKSPTTKRTTYRVRYRDPQGRDRSRTLKKLAAAREFANSVETSKAMGEYVDPRLAKQTVEEVAAKWTAVIDVAPKTRIGYASTLKNWVLPYMGGRRVRDLERSDIREYVAAMKASGASDATVKSGVKILRLVLGFAIDQGAIKANPAARANLPSAQNREMHYLTPDQVRQLADAIPVPRQSVNGRYTPAPNQYRTLVLFAAYTGLRAGEIAGLRVRRLDLASMMVTVAETVGDINGVLVMGPTKTRRIRRVPIPSFLHDDLDAIVNHRWYGKDPDNFVFSSVRVPSQPFRHNNFYGRYFKPACRAIGHPEMRFHDLRHTYAAMLIRLGAHPKAIMERLGHTSITVTMDLYGHLLPEINEGLTTGLDGLWDNTGRDPIIG